MIQLDFGDHRPLYEQICEKIKGLIISGVLVENDKIPYVREMAAILAINPNTIQKAYKELESEGYIYSVTAKGYFVTPRASTDVGKNAELLAKFSDTVRELMYLGKTKNELSDIINSIYKGGTNDGNDNG